MNHTYFKCEKCQNVFRISSKFNRYVPGAIECPSCFSKKTITVTEQYFELRTRREFSLDKLEQFWEDEE